MTSVSKKINKLVSNPENDLTAELEIPELNPEDHETDDQEFEANAETAGFSQSEIQARFDELANAEPETAENADSADPQPAEESDTADPEAAATSDTDSLNLPQIDIEKLRAEWAGLEQEINKKFTAEIDQLEISQLKEKLESSTREVDARQQELDEVRGELERSLEEARQLANELELAREEAKEEKSTNRDLQKQLTASEKKIGSIETSLEELELRRQKENKKSESRNQKLKETKKQLSESNSSLSELRKQFEEHQQTWKQVEDELAEVKASLEKTEGEVDSLTGVVKKRDADLERGQSTITKLSRELDAQLVENQDLKSENRELHRIARNDAAQELERSYKLIAEQSGRLTGNEQEISALTAQIERTERYADELRHQLREQSETAEHALANRHELVADCTAAKDKVKELTEELTAIKQQYAVATKKLGTIEKDFEKEVRQIRLELGQAQETIADQETINVELTSDLFNTKGSQKGLEAELEQAKEEYEEKIQQLEQQANKLRNQLDDYEYKLENKDEAITALMNELANRGDAQESVDEIENVISEIEKVIDDIDERLPENAEEEEEGDRERVTRLLIGENDGQELRFPLFKDRLTIGRTAHNDIQLNAQFISRQHAVIVTENGNTKIVDWGSKNGVLVNEKRISEQLLENGDIVTIGTTDFRYEERPKR
jgi:chromosome segregation ATPase